MGKVNAPKEDRPPKRFDAFVAQMVWDGQGEGVFRVLGVYRDPRPGEYAWSGARSGVVGPVVSWFRGDPRVILEKIA